MINAGVPAISCCLVWPHLHTPSEQSGEEPANVIRLLEEAGGGEVGVIEWEVGSLSGRWGSLSGRWGSMSGKWGSLSGRWGSSSGSGVGTDLACMTD